MTDNFANSQKDKQNIDAMYRQVKAEQLGVDVASLKSSHVNGKRVFSTQDTESNPQKIVRQRSVRGDGSMVENINTRLTDIEELIKDLEDKKQIVGMDLYDLFDQLGLIAEKSESIIHPLVDLEEDIDKRKQSVPDYKKYHRIFIDIQKLRHMGDIKAAEELQAGQDSNFREFRLVYRALIPILDQARELRLALLKESRRLINIQYNLMRKFLYWQTNETFVFVENNSGDANQYQEYLKVLKPWKNIPEFKMSTWKQGTPVTRQIAMIEGDINTLSEQVDDSLPTASEFINKITHLIQKEIGHLAPVS